MGFGGQGGHEGAFYRIEFLGVLGMKSGEKPQNRRKASLGEKIGKAFSLPMEVVGALPLLELKGDCQLRVENHRGILAYDPREIHIAGGKVSYRVTGEGLELKTMSRGELVILGQIKAVETE